MRGMIWYQGESNAGRAYQYRTLLPTMILDWRSRWSVGKFPFYIVQLANFQATKPDPGEDEWAELREAQSLTAQSLPNCGVAVTIDIGDAADIHRDRAAVSARLDGIEHHVRERPRQRGGRQRQREVEPGGLIHLEGYAAVDVLLESAQDGGYGVDARLEPGDVHALGVSALFRLGAGGEGVRVRDRQVPQRVGRGGNARVVLADREIQATLSRTWRNLGFFNKLKLLSAVAATVFTRHDITEEELERLGYE